MTQTVTRLFDRYEDAQNALRELEGFGVRSDDVSLIANRGGAPREDASFGNRSDGDGDDAAEGAAKGAGSGALLGGALGGGLGLTAALTTLAIPGIGPVAAAGWLGAMLTGAAGGAVAGGATGGIVGALTEAGHSEEDAHVYAEGVRRGGTLVSVRTDDEETTRRVEQLFHRYDAADAGMRGQEYRQGGWSRFDERGQPWGGQQAQSQDGFRR